MKLNISAKTKIEDVQKKFTEEYPFLKMDFYNHQHAVKELSAIEDMISPERLFSSEGHYSDPVNIDINKDRTVASLEKEFYEKLGVSMQVSRRSGDIWIQTSKTDNRTLEMQNESGKAMNSFHKDIESKTQFE